MTTVATATGAQQVAFEAAVSRTAQVLEVAYTTAALKAAHRNAELTQVIDGLYPGVSREVRREGVQVGTEGSFDKYLSRVFSPFLPNGVDPQQVVPIFNGSNILEQINLRVESWDTPVRKFDYDHLPAPFEATYGAINNVQGRKQDGVYTDSRLMLGFKDDVVPNEPTPETGFINFDLHTLTRREHEGRLDERGQKFIHPGKLVLPMAVQLAEHGIDKALNRFGEDYFVVRTEKAETKPPEGKKKGLPVWDLDSGADGVGAAGYNDDFRIHSVVAGGSPNHKS